MKRLRNNRLARSRAFRCFTSELIGTYLLVVLVLCAVANAVVAGLDGERQAPALASTIGAGLGIAISLYVTFGVSGGHLNPIVTCSLFSIGHISLADVFLYQLAQYAGAFLAAGTTYFFYSPMLDAIDGGQRKAFGQNGTAHIFVTMPHVSVSAGRAFADQTFTSGIFILAVLSIVDERSLGTPRHLQPLLIGLVVMGIALCTYGVGGTTLNPARDFSPRLLAFMVGYGAEVFTSRSYAFWVPLLGPYVGGVIGAWTYQVFFGWPIGCMRHAEEAAKIRELQLEEEAALAGGDGVAGDDEKKSELQELLLADDGVGTKLPEGEVEGEEAARTTENEDAVRNAAKSQTDVSEDDAQKSQTDALEDARKSQPDVSEDAPKSEADASEDEQKPETEAEATAETEKGDGDTRLEMEPAKAEEEADDTTRLLGSDEGGQMETSYC